MISIALSACGGGGGGGGGSSRASFPPPLTYSGNTNPAVITTDNARTLAQMAVGFSGVPVAFVAGVVTVEQPSGGSPGIVTLIPKIKDSLQNSVKRFKAPSGAMAGVAVNETDPCDLSGSVSFSGNIDSATGTGILDVTYNACVDFDGTLNGHLTYKVDAFDLFYFEPTDSTFNISYLQFTQTGIDVSMSGSMRSQVSVSTGRDTLSNDLVAKDNLLNQSAKVENLALVVDAGSIFALMNHSGPYDLSIAGGRLFDSTEGFVDIATAAPWSYGSFTQEFPSSGGSMVLTGANNARIGITPGSATLAQVDLDVNGDGSYERFSTMPWTVLETARGAANSAPVANAGTDQTVPKSTTVTLDGSASSDPDYDFIAYQWTLTQRPNGSQAQLSGATTVHPGLKLDLEGNYVVSLVVNDGKLSSTASTVTLTAFNTAPVAKVDALYLGYNGIQALLDASQSSDANNDPLIFNWSLTLKPQGSAAALSDIHATTPSFTPDVIGAYRFSLTVNDGTVDSPTVAVTAYAVAAPAATPQIHVPGDYATIQAAINAASPGDVIAVAPGTYTGSLTFNGKNVILQSTVGASRTTIEGGNGTAVDIGPDGAVIGFTIRNAVGSFGGGMETHGTGTQVRNNIFEANSGFESGIYGNSASPVIDGNVFRNNSCDDQFLSGVVGFVNSSSPVITNNLFKDNPCRALNISLPSGPAPQIFNNTIVSNRTGVRVNRFVGTAAIYRNNAIVGNDLGFDADGATDAENPVWENNLVFGNGTNYNGTADKTGVSGNIAADPLFVDQAGGFYYPNAGSPLIDHGAAAGAPSTDFLGRPRPVDGDASGTAAHDIGAFEFTP